jgi:hypothetical protein
MIISWWSAGVTSAVATKLIMDEFGIDNVCPVYFHIDSAHSDNQRFKSECEQWYGKEIRTVKAKKYNDQFDVIQKERYINGPSGAKCTQVLKKALRQQLENELDFEAQVFGFEYSKKEINRAIRFKEQYPSSKPLFPLIEHKITKSEAMFILNKQGIKNPTMYTLGYGNNNCIGCVKGGKGYWNKIRVDFPDTFNKMIEMENMLGRSCIKGTFLKDLDPSAGRKLKVITPDCGNFCDIEFEDIIDKRVETIYQEPKQLRFL